MPYVHHVWFHRVLFLFADWHWPGAFPGFCSLVSVGRASLLIVRKKNPGVGSLAFLSIRTNISRIISAEILAKISFCLPKRIASLPAGLGFFRIFPQVEPGVLYSASVGNFPSTFWAVIKLLPKRISYFVIGGVGGGVGVSSLDFGRYFFSRFFLIFVTRSLCSWV